MVSRPARGTATFGTARGHGADADTAAAIFNACAEAGGNVINTADIIRSASRRKSLATC